MPGRPALPDDIKVLMALVRAGKLFEVQKWIVEGKRTVPPKPYWFSPMRVAVESGFHSMVEVLLQAGIDQDEKDYMLSNAVWSSNLDLIKLLVDYGANLHDVDFEDVCRTGNPEIMRFFLDRGIDAVTGHPFAQALCHPRRPQLGIYMRYRDKIPDLKYQVNLALRYHAQQGNLKWVCLLLWAGGDPHIKLPDIGEKPHREDTSALEEAIWLKRKAIVDKIGIDPKRDNLNSLLIRACYAEDGPMIERLIQLGASVIDCGDHDPMRTLVSKLQWKIYSGYGPPTNLELENALANIVLLASKGGRWQPDSNYSLKRFRREIYRLDAQWIEKIVNEFLAHNVCSKALLLELITAPKMKQIFGPQFSKLKNLLSCSD